MQKGEHVKPTSASIPADKSTSQPSATSLRRSPPRAKKLAPVQYAYSYLNADVTRMQYKKRLKLFFDYIGMEGADLEDQGQAFLDEARQDSTWASQQIQSFMVFQRERVLVKKELAAGTIKNFLKPIRAFLESYDDVYNRVPWKRIGRSLPRARMYSNDRAPALNEIRKLVEYPDRRIKPIVYTMCSSGIRVGAWDYLRWKHVTPYENDKGEVIAAKLVVYAGEQEEYISFVTPEAFFALKEWMSFRQSYGETITPDSPLMRDMFATTDIKRRKSRNDNFYATVKNPQKLSSGSVKRILIRAAYEQGLREDLAEGTRRHDWKSAHGMRKWYKTRAEQVMNRLNVEFLMGHSIGLNSNYYRPTELELLTDYQRAIPVLTINDQNVESLKEHQQEKDKELQDTRKQLQELQAQQKEMRQAMDFVISKLEGDILGRSEKIRNEVKSVRQQIREEIDNLTTNKAK